MKLKLYFIPLVLYILFRDYLGGNLYDNTDKLNDKVVIVTGANTGIGKEIARDLAKREAKVIMACRDMDKCEIVLILLSLFLLLLLSFNKRNKIKYQIDNDNKNNFN